MCSFIVVFERYVVCLKVCDLLVHFSYVLTPALASPTMMYIIGIWRHVGTVCIMRKFCVTTLTLMLLSIACAYLI